MKRALLLLVCAAVAVVVLRQVRLGDASLWQQGQRIWHSPVYQKGVKGVGDRLIDRLRPAERRREGARGGGDGCSRPKAARTAPLGNERGPDDERDLPPAPIPPPKEPLLHHRASLFA